MAKLEEMELIGELYEELAHAIEDVRQGLGANAASDTENKFLAKLAFLALRRLADPSQQRALISAAKAEYVQPVILRH